MEGGIAGGCGAHSCQMSTSSTIQHARASLHDRLRTRRGEIEQAIGERVHGISNPRETADPEYLLGLHTALNAALDFALAAIERGEERSPAPPDTLLAQARLAARNGVGLDIVLRRYVAGYGLLGEFIAEEAAQVGLSGAEMTSLLHGQAALFDDLIAAVSEAHSRERRTEPPSTGRRRAQRVAKLLAGEVVDATDLNYEFAANHLAAIACGELAEAGLRTLAAALGRRLLLVAQDDGCLWAWLGGRCRLRNEEIDRALSRSWPSSVPLALGEPADDFSGWRRSHRQARAAFPIALSDPGAPVRYGEVALVASIVQDDLLASSLRRTYLAPLARDRDGGETLRQTLHVYFGCDRNAASAAAALRVSRQTVVNRLRTVEDKLDRSLVSCALEVEAALRLEEITDRLPVQRPLASHA
jgi:hypothetical protein